MTGTGISCGSDCTETFGSSQSVTLTATASTDSTFRGWSGTCTGTGTCQVTTSIARSVTATFERTDVGVIVGRPPGGSPGLMAVLMARAGCGDIVQIQFGRNGVSFDNASVTITSPGGGPAGRTSGFLYTPPAGTRSVGLSIQRVVQSGGAMVSPVTFRDACGDWTTLIGGGPNAFR